MSDEMELRKFPWTRIIGEGALIIVSVYLAIVLEGVSQDWAAAQAAHAALAQMLDEMREDARDLEEIRAEQLERNEQYEALINWLGSPDTIPIDSVAVAMDSIISSNRTLYPRRSAWTTMVADGQLRELDAPSLVARLGNFYESVSARIIDNGNDYDESLNDIARNSVPLVWDGIDRRLMTTNVEQLTIFRNQLRFMQLAWNVWYLELLDDYEKLLDTLILDIESYLRKSGHQLVAQD